MFDVLYGDYSIYREFEIDFNAGEIEAKFLVLRG